MPAALRRREASSLRRGEPVDLAELRLQIRQIRFGGQQAARCAHEQVPREELPPVSVDVLPQPPEKPLELPAAELVREIGVRAPRGLEQLDRRDAAERVRGEVPN